MRKKSPSGDPLTALLVCPILIPPRENEFVRFVECVDRAAERLIEKGVHPVFLAKVKRNGLDLVERTKSPLSLISAHEFGKASAFSLRDLFRFGLEMRQDIIGMIQPPKSGLGGPDDAGGPGFDDRLVAFLEPLLDRNARHTDFRASDESTSIALRKEDFVSWAGTLGQDPFRHFLRKEIVVFRRTLMEELIPEWTETERPIIP